MAGIFPEGADGGIPPNPADLSNPKAAYPPATLPLNTAALYYGNGCDVRLRPEVLNSIISEIEATVDQAGVAYDPSRRENLELATRYLIQRGLQTGTVLQGGPFDYTGTLDPTMTAYNNYLTLIVLPSVANQGAVRVEFDGKGLVPVLRNDGLQMEAADLRGNIPALISYWNGNFYHVGLAASQVPILMKGGVDLWIRTDGNDTTGDGSANDPAKAFKTLTGAWNKAGGRFASTPLFSMNFKFGIPGVYEGASIGPFGGTVTLTGDPANAAAYTFTSIDLGNGNFGNLAVLGITSFKAIGVTFTRNVPAPTPCYALIGSRSAIVLDRCAFDSSAANAGSFFVRVSGGSFGAMSSTAFNGRSLAIGGLIQVDTVGVAIFAGAGINYSFVDCPMTASAFFVYGLGPVRWDTVCTLTSTNCTGPQYTVTENSILNMGAKTPPGTVAGTATFGGQYIP
jgi:hypothetical protein